MVYSFGKLNNASFKSLLCHVTTVRSQLNGEATAVSHHYSDFLNWCLI